MTTHREGESVPLYFGCWFSSNPGHGLHHRNGWTAFYKGQRQPCPWSDSELERLAPRTGCGSATAGDGAAGGQTQQGAGRLHHRNGWTALAVDDFTGDRRPNSKSVFIFPEVLGWDDAWVAAQEHFPHLTARCGTPFDFDATTASGRQS